MILKNGALFLLGSSFGLLAAGGMFTVLLTVGLIPRFAGKTHTGRWVLLYENAVILGTIFGTVLSVLDVGMGKVSQMPVQMPVEVSGQMLAQMSGQMLAQMFSYLFLLLWGTFAGIFVGSLAMAIAEMLDTIPIFARRIALRHGLGIIVSAMAVGKLAGSLFYFYTGMDMFGG